MTESNEEIDILANEKLKEVTYEIGVEVKIDKIQRLESFEREHTTPRYTIVTLSNNWDMRIVLAKSSEKLTRMKEMGIHLLPALSAEDEKRENLCLKNSENSCKTAFCYRC